MKLASSYLYRPLLVQAIQLPGIEEEFTGEWLDSAREMLEPAKIEFEPGGFGKVAIIVDGTPVGIMAPGSWIVKEGPHRLMLTNEEFQRRFIPAELADEHVKLEAERFSPEIQHVTTP